MYTTSYPIARISLALLYRRIFIQSWVRWTCWFLIFCYAGYAIGSFFADVFTFKPIASGWDLNVTRTHTINIKALYLANSGFNIGTDIVLLLLPLAAIWNIRLSVWRKVGLGLIFSLGCLTVIASIFRLALYYTYNTLDPNCKSAPPYVFYIPPPVQSLVPRNGHILPSLGPFQPKTDPLTVPDL